MRKVLNYRKKTMNYGLNDNGYPSVLEGYFDASWIANQEIHGNTSGWIFMIGSAISWGSKKQICIEDSTMAAEFSTSFCK